jgi:hypothetical protein
VVLVPLEVGTDREPGVFSVIAVMLVDMLPRLTDLLYGVVARLAEENMSAIGKMTVMSLDDDTNGYFEECPL